MLALLSHQLKLANVYQECEDMGLDYSVQLVIQTELRLMDFISKFYVDSKNVSEKLLHRPSQ